MRKVVKNTIAILVVLGLIHLCIVSELARGLILGGLGIMLMCAPAAIFLFVMIVLLFLTDEDKKE